ncbi:UPF0619 GPI-anchored membrane protein [Phlyctema vagabunda]|uniref:UPF0619 GPI-anchored membrane protein n=1 Tax=Phlyctema vagabunda TaxID=108571 RepID=A0ABR4PEP6_9HELO
MPSFTSILSVAAFAALAQAITITSPSRNGEWDSDDTNTITWTSVSTDPTTIDIYLVHQASQPQTRDLLFSDVAVSQGSVDVTGLQLPTGEAYQINFVKPDSPEQIYAQSEQFEVSGVAASATSTLAGYTGPTFTPSTAASTASSTASSSSAASAESSGTSSLTSGSASASTTVSVSSTLTTSTGSSTTSTGSVAASTSTGTVSGTSTSGSASGTGSASASASSAAASGNAAPDMRASAPLAALVFGAFAMLA